MAGDQMGQGFLKMAQCVYQSFAVCFFSWAPWKRMRPATGVAVEAVLAGATTQPESASVTSSGAHGAVIGRKAVALTKPLSRLRPRSLQNRNQSTHRSSRDDGADRTHGRAASNDSGKIKLTVGHTGYVLDGHLRINYRAPHPQLLGCIGETAASMNPGAGMG